MIAVEAARYPPVRDIAHALGARSEVLPVPIPLNCTDGFNEAYYGRPHMLLEPAARLACSAWSFVSEDVVRRFENQLASDIKSGRWDRHYGHYQAQPFFDGSLKLIVGRN